jgi:hypothetical protein
MTEYLRYVGVIEFVFHVSNVNQLDLHNEICVALASKLWSIGKYQTKN